MKFKVYFTDGTDTEFVAEDVEFIENFISFIISEKPYEVLIYNKDTVKMVHAVETEGDR